MFWVRSEPFEQGLHGFMLGKLNKRRLSSFAASLLADFPPDVGLNPLHPSLEFPGDSDSFDYSLGSVDNADTTVPGVNPGGILCDVLEARLRSSFKLTESESVELAATLYLLATPPSARTAEEFRSVDPRTVVLYLCLQLFNRRTQTAAVHISGQGEHPAGNAKSPRGKAARLSNDSDLFDGGLQHDFVLRHLDMMLRLIAGGLPQAGGDSGATGDDLAGLELSARGFECLSLLIGGGPDEHAASPSIAALVPAWAEAASRDEVKVDLVALRDLLRFNLGLNTRAYPFIPYTDHCEAWERPVLASADEAIPPPGADVVPVEEPLCFLDVVKRTAVFVDDPDQPSRALKVAGCMYGTIYALSAFDTGLIYGCRGATIVAGAVSRVLSISSCSNCKVVTTASMVVVKDSSKVTIFSCSSEGVVISGACHVIRIAPYNTTYPLLERHMSVAGIDPAGNRWSSVTEHLSNTSATFSSSYSNLGDLIQESKRHVYDLLDPQDFIAFEIPLEMDQGDTEGYPCVIPRAYRKRLKASLKAGRTLQQMIDEAGFDPPSEASFQEDIKVLFRTWMNESGASREVKQVAMLAKDARRQRAGKAGSSRRGSSGSGGGGGGGDGASASGPSGGRSGRGSNGSGGGGGGESGSGSTSSSSSMQMGGPGASARIDVVRPSGGASSA